MFPYEMSTRNKYMLGFGKSSTIQINNTQKSMYILNNTTLVRRVTVISRKRLRYVPMGDRTDIPFIDSHAETDRRDYYWHLPLHPLLLNRDSVQRIEARVIP